MLRLLRIGIGLAALGMTACGLLALTIASTRLLDAFRSLFAGRKSIETELALIGSVDLFLLGIGILVITAGIVNLTIRSISLPRGLQFTDLHQLKSTFASFLILVMAIIYLESLSSLRSLESRTSSNPIALLYAGIGFLAVTVGLIMFQRGGHGVHHEHHEAPAINKPN